MKKYPLLLLIALFSLFHENAAGQLITSYGVGVYDVCATVNILSYTSGCSSGQTMTYYYGDGTSDTRPLSCSAGTSVNWTPHVYPSLGVYTVKLVLNAPTRVDSVTYDVVNPMCRFLRLGEFVDNNSNCSFDSGDYNYGYSCSVEVDSSGTPVDTIELSAAGWYHALGPAGTVYSFKIINLPTDFILSCPASGIIYDTLPTYYTDTVACKYFALNCISAPGNFDLDVHASFRASTVSASAGVTVSNTSCVGTPTLLRINHSPKYAFNSVIPAFSYTVSGNSVTIDVGTVGLLPIYASLSFLPATTLTMGDTINTQFIVTPMAGDVDTTNNMAIRCDTIRASYDPNYKSVLPTGEIAAGSELHYMIEFENTGNDTAHNIHILDTLSSYLDVSSFHAGPASHKLMTGIYEDGGYRILKFDFPNIMLPDSSHHDACKGYATFSMRAISTISPGSAIANRAGIYFDVNEVVMTNTTYNNVPLVNLLNGNEQMGIKLYPNPANNTLNIMAPGRDFNSADVFNILGQHIDNLDVSTFPLSYNVEALSHGLYYIVLSGEKNIVTVKFQKE